MPAPPLFDVEGRLVAVFSRVPPSAVVWVDEGQSEAAWVSAPALANKEGVALSPREAGAAFKDVDFAALDKLAKSEPVRLSGERPTFPAAGCT